MSKETCTHYRKGNKVYRIDGGTLEFDGTPEKAHKKNEKYKDEYTTYTRKGKKLICVGRYYINHGINAAKRYVRNNNLDSYTMDE
jgi:hypothetical protein